MSRLGLAALAVALSATLICGPSYGQAPTGDLAKRTATARKLNAKMPACKAEANQKKLIFTARRAFMRSCLKD